MWKEVLQTTKPQIGLNIVDIPEDIPEEDCCQMAKDMWKKHWVRYILSPSRGEPYFPRDYIPPEGSGIKNAKDFYYKGFDINNDEDCMKIYYMLYHSDDVDANVGMAYRTCEEFREWHGLPKKIRDAWDKCEGK
tara:strand:+ start:6514 stop:6915 length:402 start_codon:yes stop_codon:yes gene_type:complete